MRRILALLLLAAGPTAAQAPMLFLPICRDGEIVGMRIGLTAVAPAGTEVTVVWEPGICKGRDA